MARELVETQFPDFAPVRTEPLGAGWDSAAYLVNGSHVFRFPQRRMGSDCLEEEIRVMPGLAPRLPLPAPNPDCVGRATDVYPWRFAGHRMIPGRTACVAALSEEQRIAMAGPLARFLAFLHAIPHEEAGNLGARPDWIGKLNLAKRVPQARAYLEKARALDILEDTGPCLAAIDDSVRGLPETPDPALYRTLVHGDLYVRHLLVDDEARLCGVIDWGDVHIGDPAVDISIAHGFLPPSARDAFRRAYGPIEESTWRLARFRALVHSAIIAVYGKESGDDDLLREGLQCLRHAADVAP